jgi:cyclopropane fatty-acyl-phospholipid synthase-like methyltransferase
MTELLRHYEILEAYHTIQNPMSPEKLDRLIEYLEITDGDRVVDVGSGKGWLLRRIAERRRVEAIGLDLSEVFTSEARMTLAEASLIGQVEIIQGPALAYPAAEAAFDVGMSIGTTFALGGLEGTLGWMARVVRVGGRIAIGEPYAKAPFRPAIAAHRGEYDRTLQEFVDLVASRGFEVTGMIAASDDDWDHYESPHWRAGLAWARAHAGEPEAETIRAQVAERRRLYLEEERDVFGWAIVVAERVGS